MSGNIAALAEAQGLARQDAVQLARDSLAISWADDERIRNGMEQLEHIAAR